MAMNGAGALMKVGGTIVVEFRDGTIEETHSPVDATRRSDPAPRLLDGRRVWTLTASVHYDKADVPQTLLRAGDEVAITFYPEGDQSGDQEFGGTGRVGSASVAVTQGDDTVQKSVTITGSNGVALTQGNVA